MPRKETRHSGILGDLQGLSAVVEANKEEIPGLEPFWLKLSGIVTQTLETRSQQAALRAAKQESSKQLRRLLTEGQSVANVIRTVVKDHFGSREEKVVEFGLQPFRGRKSKAATEETAPTTPPASAGSAAPTTPDL